MRTLVRSLNILIAVLASCVLGLALYGVLRPPVAVSATGAPHTEELAQAPDQGSPDGENQTGDLWQQGLGQTEQGNWAAAIDDLEGALEQYRSGTCFWRRPTGKQSGTMMLRRCCGGAWRPSEQSRWSCR